MNYSNTNHSNTTYSPEPCANQISEISKNLNTAFVATQDIDNSLNSDDLKSLQSSPAYTAILSAIGLHADTAGIGQVEAAADIINTFRKIDATWKTFVLQEGLKRIKGTKSSG